jgi:undecaprenyl-diphosphatase
MFLGLKREAAARFSFLLSVPAIGASGILELFEAVGHLDQQGIRTLVVATVVAAISGYACIALLLRYLRTRTMRVFVFYRCLIGSMLILAVLAGWLDS